MAAASPAIERNTGEALFIGTMLLAYGELELLVAALIGAAIGSIKTAATTMFRIIGESSRIQAADALMRDFYKSNGLGAEYAVALGAVKYCIKLRNQYAHCHWADDSKAGLFFTELTIPAQTTEIFGSSWFRHIDIGLAHEQNEYFNYAADCLRFLGFQNALRAGTISPESDVGIVMPPKRSRPILYNPPEAHVPPWLTEDEKRRHIEHAQARKAVGHSRPNRPKVHKPSVRQRREMRIKAALQKRPPS